MLAERGYEVGGVEPGSPLPPAEEAATPLPLRVDDWWKRLNFRRDRYGSAAAAGRGILARRLPIGPVRTGRQAIGSTRIDRSLPQVIARRPDPGPQPPASGSSRRASAIEAIFGQRSSLRRVIAFWIRAQRPGGELEG